MQSIKGLKGSQELALDPEVLRVIERDNATRIKGAELWTFFLQECEECTEFRVNMDIELNASLATADELSKELGSMWEECSSVTDTPELKSSVYRSSPVGSNENLNKPSPVSSSRDQPAQVSYFSYKPASLSEQGQSTKSLDSVTAGKYQSSPRPPSLYSPDRQAPPLGQRDHSGSPRTVNSDSLFSSEPRSLPRQLSHNSSQRMMRRNPPFPVYESGQSGLGSPRSLPFERSPSPHLGYPANSSTMPRNFKTFKSQDDSLGRPRPPNPWNESDLDIGYKRTTRQQQGLDKYRTMPSNTMPFGSWRESNLDTPPSQAKDIGSGMCPVLQTSCQQPLQILDSNDFYSTVTGSTPLSGCCCVIAVSHPIVGRLNVTAAEVMRVRWSRKLGLLAKTCFLLSLLWVAYLILEMSTSSYQDSNGEGAGRNLLERQFSNKTLGKEQLSQPVYQKPPPDSNAPGEWGKAARLQLDPEQKKEEEESIERYAINIHLSDKISLHRHIVDRRMYECRSKVFDYQKLPTTSVIISFYNEAWSTLLRTIHSVLETTPAVLLKEIILIDDFSDRAYLKSQLEEYISNLDRVRLIRTNKREGLVRGRLIGATYSTGDVLTFLDCHCECVPGWIEPLLERIGENKTAIVCPVIDTINWNTFEYYMQRDEPMIGGFDWRLTFQWHSVPEQEHRRRKSKIDPIRSPTMAGGLFAVSKEYFHYLGTYDMGMEVWGGENLELSFRVWQCGGTLEIHPCSHVGHVFPKKAPYARPNFLQNTVRTAEVLIFLFVVVFYMFPIVRSSGIHTECLDYNTPDHNPTGAHLSLFGCHGQGGNQYFESTSKKEIRFNSVTEICAEVPDRQKYITVSYCPRDGTAVPENIIWEFRNDGTIYHPHSNMCITSHRTSDGRTGVEMRLCNPKDTNQIWSFE
ncbi:GALT4 acetylgalactosaminyltransferase, partial [Polyodon spathula]|nr:GALT4 acetylgalactosaminyltransferase [Polyodon spathula]